MIHRRDLYRLGTFALGGLMGAVLTVPGVRYLLDPLQLFDPRRRSGKAGDFQALARLGDLKVGVPQLLPVIAERVDSWVKYPKEPIGSVWLIRQPAGASEPVVAFTAECPHMGCAVGLAADARTFQCPCHKSAFTLDGRKENQVPPRGMDRLEVAALDPNKPDAEVRVKFRRFRLGSKEKTPVA